ncbi:NAD(P)-dependent dehydrogenase (short-subunit alcohol dehydrogenase family) [Streptosporangium becharense]|uniref:NAD(P)-dependent dehydrogenase (Short-subunit alcohol dehydrogenase family) n=1 Tax=Streptosporangium becharense TaxID=1816182 RepID=A0A7W9MEG3_9ACTN|nr:SDR family NAD(P)-dependent oxidoreductase [Streptosporangium becharense]MBB2914186.1 NAD(P)-dependent dehydrogenase (short-subunit alcohol dehydrogenase family) [Streptosporangium becharense]MBB5817213.1 NAD(P)-dependent dehydrogenase (short-subunit alcohol dehydrogenase family) [Streptosporangium becharense]
MTPAPTVMITGATDGLGLALAHRLAADGTRLLLHGRDPGRLRRAALEVCRRHDCPPPVTVCADLSELAQVRRLAREVASVTDRLDVLVNNAGTGFGGPGDQHRRLSADGHELRFAVNHLAGFDLTLRLLPLLRRAPHARIVNVASIGQHPIDFDDVMLEHGHTPVRAYRQSKLAQIIAGFELAERLRGERITVNSLHPATYMPTKIVLAALDHSVDTLEAGTEATWRLVGSADLSGITGRFFDRTREARAHPTAYRQDVRTRLWQLSLRLTGAPSP